jgi:hypothetical protein
MKRIIVTGVVSAIAAVSFAGTASAFTPGTPQCFGQVHKAVNAGALAGADGNGPANVGQLLKALDATGQGKKAVVNAAPYCP